MFNGVVFRPALMLCVCACVVGHGSLPRAQTRSLGAKTMVTPRPAGVWPVRTFTVDGRIWAFEQTEDGRLWLGGSQGLQTFDGKVFTLIEGSTEPRGEIRALTRTADGTLYVAGIQGLWRLNKGATKFHKLGEPGEGVLSLHPKGNDVWVGTQRGLYWTQGDQLRLIPDSAMLSISALAVATADGDLWVGTLEGIWVCHNQALSRYWQGSQVRAFAQKGGRWFAGTDQHGLLDLSADQPIKIQEEGLWSPSVLSMAKDRNDVLWIGHTSGLAQSENGRFLPVLQTKDLPVARVHGLFVDDSQNVWLALDGNAIAELRQDLEIRSYPPAAANELPFAMTQSASGDVWMTTDRAFEKWNEAALTVVMPAARDFWTLRSIQADKDGSLWATDVGEGIVRLVPKGDSYDFEEPADRGKGVSGSYMADDGTLWMGLDNGDVKAQRNGTIVRYPSSPDACPSPVLRMLQKAPGEVLVATNGRGLCLLHTDTKRFERIGTESENRIPITSLARLSDGEIWIGSLQNGVGRLREKKIVWVGYDQGLRAELVGAILEDRSKNVWLAARSGIFRVPRGDLEAAADRRRSIIEPLVFSTADGLLSTDCISGWAEPALIDHQGRLWVLTLKGPLVMEHPDQIAPPRWHEPRIVSMAVNGLPLSANDGAPIRAAADRGNLEIHYGAVALSEGRRLRYRYLLEGFDRSWVQAEDRATAFYTNLAPGSYRFRLQASLVGLAGPVEMRPLSLNLVPPFHRTLPFYFACALAAVLLTISITRVRANNRRRQHQLLATERRRISQDIHDSLEQTFVAMRFQVDAARRSLPPVQDAHAPLDRTMSLMNRAMKETRAAIWALRAEFPGKADLVTQVAVVAGEAAQGQGMAVEVKSHGLPFSLPAEVQRQAVQITREGLSNAMKHARAQRVLVEISFTESAAVLRVKDDGQGFVQTNELTLVGHYGLSGMRERAQQIRSALQITSAPGQGTIITLTIPRPQQAPKSHKEAV